MSHTNLSVPPTVLYCPRCADVFGTIDGAGRRCRCSNSKGIVPFHGDLDSGFEICWYCQAELINAGSRWSTFYCDYCRPVVHAVNDVLDGLGLVSLPIGRHSLMHSGWQHARPFSATPIVAEWSLLRLRSGWKRYKVKAGPAPWTGFGIFLLERRETEHPDAVREIAELVQRAEPDFLLEEMRAVMADVSAELNIDDRTSYSNPDDVDQIMREILECDASGNLS
jgi:hypothetical protein